MARNVLTKTTYNTLFGPVVIADDDEVRVGEGASVVSYIGRELGIDKKLTKLALFSKALADPAAYLTGKIASIRKIKTDLGPIFETTYSNAIAAGESDETALAKAKKFTKEQYEQLMTQHRLVYPKEITDKFKLGSKL